MFIGKYNRSVILTYVGLVTAVMGIFLSIDGKTEWAFIALIIAGICDLFDGVVARRVKRNEEEKEFGVQIDSLVDIISFGAFPAVLMYTTGMRRWYHIIVLVFYVLCVVIRLAYFNIHRTDGGYYTGVPVTYSALVLTLLYCITIKISSVNSVLFMIGMLMLSFLYILRIRIKKPTGVWYIIFGLLAIALILFILLTVREM